VSNRLLHKAISTLIFQFLEIEKVELQSIELELRILIESILVDCLEENDISTFSNLRLDEVSEDNFCEEYLNPELLLMIKEEEHFENAWSEIMKTLKNK
tara:strand:- start:2047 stop:2343 length:297 start_codon:yes stop_codon:yes gene_type:complete